MDSVAIVLRVIEALEAIEAPYMLVGSFATNLYGVPRSTQDADVVIESSAAPAALARKLGKAFTLDPQVSFEGVTGTIRYELRHAQSRFIIELFLLTEDPHDLARFARRRETMLRGQRVFVASPEDAVVSKLRWALRGQRRKDLDDALLVLTVQGGKLDLPYIRGWCDTHGTRALLEQLLRESRT